MTSYRICLKNAFITGIWVSTVYSMSVHLSLAGVLSLDRTLVQTQSSSRPDHSDLSFVGTWFPLFHNALNSLSHGLTKRSHSTKKQAQNTRHSHAFEEFDEDEEQHHGVEDDEEVNLVFRKRKYKKDMKRSA